MNDLQQAGELQRRIRAALKIINADKAQFTESEVRFRLNAIEGMLIMANNDVVRMIRMWEEDN